MNNSEPEEPLTGNLSGQPPPGGGSTDESRLAPPPPPHRFASPQPPPNEPAGPDRGDDHFSGGQSAGVPPPPVRFEKAPPAPIIVTNTYDHARARWGLGDMAVSLAIYFLGSIALVVAILAITGSDEFLHGPWLLVGVAGPHALLLTHLLWVSRSKGQGLSPDFQFRVQWSDAGVGIGLFFAALFGAGVVAAIVTQIAGEAPTATAIDVARESADDGLTIWLYLFAILGATLIPVVEELVYRGLFWSALEKRGMHPWAILVVTSMVFAMIHLEPVRTPVLFAVGVAIGIGRLRTGRIGASILTHMLINALAMTATLVDLA